MAAKARPYPHTYIGLGTIGLRISSLQVLFDYTELAFLEIMKLNPTLVGIKLTDGLGTMKVNPKDVKWEV